MSEYRKKEVVVVFSGHEGEYRKIRPLDGRIRHYGWRRA